jgi:hypothetical protein
MKIKKFNENLDNVTHPIGGSVCYVAHQGIADLSVMFSDIHKLHRWPESGVTLFEKVQGIRYSKPILTEDPWFISCYDRKDVYVWVDGEWVNPDSQTYGTSVEIITDRILKIRSSIPLKIFGDMDDLNKIKEIYKK